MKFKTNRIGMISVVLTTKIGERTIGLNTSNMAEAELLAKDLKLDIIEQAGKSMDISRQLIRQLTQGGKKKVIEAIIEWERWLSSTSESGNTANNMASYGYAWMYHQKLRSVGVDEISEDHVDDWVNAEDGVKLNTRKFRLSVARSILKFCCIKKYIDVNVAALVRVKQKPLSLEQKANRSKRVFTDEEYEMVKAKLIEKIDAFGVGALKTKQELWLRFWYSAIVIGRRTGMRLADVCNLERAAINDGKIRTCTDKKNTWVEHVIDDEILTALTIVRHNNSKMIYPLQSEIASDPSRRCQLSNRFRAVMKMCGITDHFFHELRATKATEVDKAGGDVAETLGHSSNESAAPYILK
jgi:integrase